MSTTQAIFSEPALHVTSHFDAGAIKVVKIEPSGTVSLKLRGDNASEFSQWFYFALHASAGQSAKVQITGLSKSAFPKGWENYRPCISYDRVVWQRVDAQFDGNDTLSFTVNFEASTVYCAYFEPYSNEHYLDFIASCESCPYVQISFLGTTLQGRAMHLLKISEECEQHSLPMRKKIWLIARQHPGETMASWFIEGFLERILDPSHALAQKMREQYVFYVVPHMNLDGAVLGNLRTNFSGANLNREWQEPSLEKSPEVYHTRAAMEHIGVDMCLDIHGDETLPYVFLSGSEGTPSYNAKRAEQQKVFLDTWQATCPDLQSQYGYKVDAPGTANMSLATTWIAERFNCLAYTVEMPFKDNAKAPDSLFGWNSERSIHLAAECLYAIDCAMRTLST